MEDHSNEIFQKLYKKNRKISREKKKIISYSLWGSKGEYNYGALDNALWAKRIFPEWIVRIYHDNTIIPEIKESLLKLDNVEMIEVKKKTVSNTMWRFSPAFEQDVDVCIFRDTDGLFSIQEYLCIKEWINSEKDVHCMVMWNPKKSKSLNDVRNSNCQGHIYGKLVNIKETPTVIYLKSINFEDNEVKLQVKYKQKINKKGVFHFSGIEPGKYFLGISGNINLLFPKYFIEVLSSGKTVISIYSFRESYINITKKKGYIFLNPDTEIKNINTCISCSTILNNGGNLCTECNIDILKEKIKPKQIVTIFPEDNIRHKYQDVKGLHREVFYIIPKKNIEGNDIKEGDFYYCNAENKYSEIFHKLKKKGIGDLGEWNEEDTNNKLSKYIGNGKRKRKLNKGEKPGDIILLRYIPNLDIGNKICAGLWGCKNGLLIPLKSKWEKCCKLVDNLMPNVPEKIVTIIKRGLDQVFLKEIVEPYVRGKSLIHGDLDIMSNFVYYRHIRNFCIINEWREKMKNKKITQIPDDPIYNLFSLRDQFNIEYTLPYMISTTHSTKNPITARLMRKENTNQCPDMKKHIHIMDAQCGVPSLACEFMNEPPQNFNIANYNFTRKYDQLTFEKRQKNNQWKRCSHEEVDLIKSLNLYIMNKVKSTQITDKFTPGVKDIYMKDICEKHKMKYSDINSAMKDCWKCNYCTGIKFNPDLNEYYLMSGDIFNTISSENSDISWVKTHKNKLIWCNNHFY